MGISARLHGLCGVRAGQGAKVGQADNDGANALMWASVNGHVACVQYLGGQGGEVGQATNDGWTAVMWASECGHIACLSTWWDRGRCGAS